MTDDLVREVERDYHFAREGRYEREQLWSTYWKIYLSMEQRARVRNRSNSVGPHGGMAIRLLVPLIKRQILATRPFIHAVSRKRELDDMMDLLDLQMDLWIDQADVKSVVLTHMLKDSLIFGISWGWVNHVERMRTVTQRVPVLRDGELQFEEQEIPEVLFMGPRVTHIPVEDAYPFPTARSWDELENEGYLIHRFYKTRSELELDPRYDREALGRLGKSSEGTMVAGGIPLDTIFAEQRRRVLGLNKVQWKDKLVSLREAGDEPIEVLQRVQKGHLVAIGNRNQVIRKDDLDHNFPAFSLCPDPIPGEIFGKSIYHDSLSPMRQRDFTLNNVYDNLARLVHSQYKGMPGMYDAAALADSKPGGVVNVRRPDALEPLVQQNTIAAAFPVITHLDRDIERGHGLSEVLSTVGSGAGTSYPETATVGNLKQENALLFVSEMVSQLEDNGLRRMARIMFDLEAEYTDENTWTRLAGEEGARWRDVSFDTLAAEVDFKLVGSSYAEGKRSQAQVVGAVVDRALAIHTRDPNAIKLRELARVMMDVYDVPNADRIVPGRPVDLGPDAEHRVMQQGLPVKPDMEEDFQTHLPAHLQEIQRVIEESGEEADDAYLARLMDHVTETQKIMQAALAAAQQLQEGNDDSPAANVPAPGGGLVQ